MKKVLFIGPYRQNDGWGNAAKNYLRALRLCDISLSAQPIYLSGGNDFDNSDEFNDLEQQRNGKPDVVIQNCLPNYFVKFGDCKNIGLAYFETTINQIGWDKYIGLMDQMWVCSKHDKHLISDYHNDIEVVHIPYQRLEHTTHKLDFLRNHEHEFKFYFVGSYITRKNLKAAIVAFHNEFHPSEPFRFIVKTNGRDKFETMHRVKNDIDYIKSTMGLRIYKDDIIITENLTTKDLMALHQQCQCFVMPSSGESCCIPLCDATYNGSLSIINANTGMMDYKDPVNGLAVESYKKPILCNDRPIQDLYTSRDFWYEIDIPSLQKAMRKASTMNYLDCDFMKLYSHEKIAEQIGNII